MPRATRSSQAPVSVVQESKRNTRQNNAEKTERVTRKNSNAKKVSDENSSLPVKNGKVNKTSQLKGPVLAAKLRASKKDDSMVSGNSLSAMKSPVLRDRTNTTSELIKTSALAKKTKEENSVDKKKSVQTTRGNKVSKNNSKLSSEVQVSMERYVVKKQKLENENAKDQSAKKIEEVSASNKQTIGNTYKKIISQKSSGPSKVKKDDDTKDDKNNDKSYDSQTTNDPQSQGESVSAKRVSRRKNISMEAVEQLLNDDDEMELISHKKDSQDSLSKVEKSIGTSAIETGEENVKVTKKFFKNKNVVAEAKPITLVKKTLRRKVNKRKNIEADDSSFSPTIEEQRQSTKPPEKKLRPRVNKNYCEVSKLSRQSNTNEDKSADAANNSGTEKDQRKIPIYKTIQLSQENAKDKDEIYDYLDDSQEDADGQKGKKRKRTVKKPTMRRNRKAVITKPTISRKAQKKTTVKVQSKVPTDKPNKALINVQQNIVVPEASKHIIPEHLLNAGDSTIAEASTIKILSNEKLEGSNRISLTSTPPVPKTITSELKLFGPKNVITSKPTAKYSNMVNHSLIRKSMSPITKLDENFDTGSPWRAVDTFSRVKQIVQSTPQINRLPSMREKRLPSHVSNLNKKSINSDETIHTSSIMEEESLDKKQASTDVATINQNQVSPRKFGTVISNSSPVKSINNSNSPVQNTLQSSVQRAPSPIASSDIPIDQEDSTIPEIYNKENTLVSPKKSPRKKICTPSPFRFERRRSSKRLAPTESVELKTPKCTPQKESTEVNPEAGPSCLDKSKSTFLRQSNLNNFLNLDEMPESTRISTAHGIFDDIHSTPITGKKTKCLTEEPNIENAFGFDDSDITDVSNSSQEKSSGPTIATEQDVRDSVKGKLFPKARVKSLMPSRISENAIKKTLLKNVLVKKAPEKKQPEIFNNSDESDFEKENVLNKKNLENNNDRKRSPKEVAFDAISFSDTFDVLSENGDIQSKVPDEIPLFVDLEPVHFTKPPRRSYNKRKRVAYFNNSREDSESDEEDDEKPKYKKKKISKLSKEENKRMQEWLKNINKTFEEVDNYDLVVE